MTRADVRRYVVAYDIPDDRRRASIAKALQAFGDRIQFSVFVVDAGPAQMQRLRIRLEELMKAREDSVLVLDLGPLELAQAKRFTYLGVGRPVTDATSFSV